MSKHIGNLLRENQDAFFPDKKAENGCNVGSPSFAGWQLGRWDGGVWCWVTGGRNEPEFSSVPCQKSGQVCAVRTDGVGSARGGIDFCICPAVFAFALQQITCVTEVVVH